MTDKMSPAKCSFILTVLHNYLVCAKRWNGNQKMHKKCFANIKQRGAQAGWSQDSLDFLIKNEARD